MPFNLVMIGCSLGGLKAAQTLLGGLSRDCDIPIVIIQHRDRDIQTSGMLSNMLQESTTLKLVEAEDRTPLVGGQIFLAPADYHLLVESDRIVLSTELPVAYARPSIDVSFDSAARSYGASVAGFILTGTGTDGAQGSLSIEKRGGMIVVQDPETAEYPSMPRAAIAATRAPQIMSLSDMAPFICSLNKHGDGGHGSRAPS